MNAFSSTHFPILLRAICFVDAIITFIRSVGSVGRSVGQSRVSEALLTQS